MNQDLMLARIEEVERMDEEQIIQEIAGDKAGEYVYRFPMDGKEVKGLSWTGYRELALRWGNIRIERPIVEDIGDDLRVMVEATDLVHNVTVWAGTHQPKKRKINGRNGRADVWVHDDFAYEKAVSKAQRNVLKNLIPHAVQQAAIASVIAGKVIPIGRSTDELPQPRSNAPPPRHALPATPVDKDGVIQDGVTEGQDPAPPTFSNQSDLYNLAMERFGYKNAVAVLRALEPEVDPPTITAVLQRWESLDSAWQELERIGKEPA